MEKSQTEKLYELLSDGLPHRTDEIMEKIYGGSHLGLARVGARIYDIKKKYDVSIQGWKDKDNEALYWYQIGMRKPDEELIKKYPILWQKTETEKQNNQKSLF